MRLPLKRCAKVRNGKGSALLVSLVCQLLFATSARSEDILPLERLYLENGIPVDMAPYQADNQVRISLIVNAGNATDLTVPLMTFPRALSFMRWGGTERAATISNTLVREKAGMSTSCGPSVCFVDLLAEIDTVDGALQLMSDMVLRPIFEQDDFIEIREQTVEQFRTEVPTDNLPISMLLEYLYGRDHPLRREQPDTMAVEQFEALTLDQMVATYRRWMRPDNVRFAAIGNIPRKELLSLLNRHFGHWERPNSPLATNAVPKFVKQTEPRVFLLHSPGLRRAMVAVGGAAPITGADRQDFASAAAFLAILNSRLKSFLLDSQRSTYGRNKMLFSPWGLCPDLQFDAANDDLGAVLKQVKGEIDALTQSRPPTARELAGALNQERSIYAHLVDPKIGQRIAFHVQRQVFGFTDHPYERVNQQIPAVTAATVQNALANLEIDHALTWVIVGDVPKIEAQVRALNLGRLTVEPAATKSTQ